MRDRVDFPSWLPPLVAERARELHQQAIEMERNDEAAMIVRITSDPRMEQVWAHLRNKRRDPDERHVRTHEYEYAAIDRDPNGPYRSDRFPTRAEWRQQVALEKIYSEIIRWGGLRSRLPLSEARQYAQEATSLRAKAAVEAKHWSGTDRRINRCRAEHAKLERAYIKAADAADALAAASITDTDDLSPAIVTVRVAETLLKNFGKRMYGQTASIASVVLDQTVTAEKAREYCRGVWGYLEKKPA
jgi:hypothetical protein